MNTNQFNKLSMYGTVKAVLNSNKKWWTGFAPFANAVLALDGNIAEIRTEALRQDEAQRGVAREKAVTKERLAGLAAQVAFGLRGYASDQGDERLKHLVRFSLSQLTRSKDMLLITRASLILQEALERLEALKEYQVTPEMVKELEELIDDFTLKVNTPREAIANRAAYTKELRRLFRKTDTLLKDKLDIMMFSYNTVAQVFYSAYTAARVIVDSHRHGELLSITLNAGESKTVQRVIFDTLLTNTGATTLVCTFPAGKEGTVNTVTVLPGKKEKVRTVDGTITVTNDNKEKPGSFTIRVTSTRPLNEEEEGEERV